MVVSLSLSVSPVQGVHLMTAVIDSAPYDPELDKQKKIDVLSFSLFHFPQVCQHSSQLEALVYMLYVTKIFCNTPLPHSIVIKD